MAIFRYFAWCDNFFTETDDYCSVICALHTYILSIGILRVSPVFIAGFAYVLRNLNSLHTLRLITLIQYVLDVQRDIFQRCCCEISPEVYPRSVCAATSFALCPWSRFRSAWPAVRRGRPGEQSWPCPPSSLLHLIPCLKALPHPHPHPAAPNVHT